MNVFTKTLQNVNFCFLIFPTVGEHFPFNSHPTDGWFFRNFVVVKQVYCVYNSFIVEDNGLKLMGLAVFEKLIFNFKD